MASRKQLTLHSFMKKSGRNTSVLPATAEQITTIQRQWLLDAVKHVKAQKQRPDRERICHYIQQHHDLTSETVSLLLDSAVKENILTTTITRGNSDKLTYVINDPVPPAPVETVTKSKTSAINNDLSSQTDKQIIHNKSDIGLLVVKAVKALRESTGSTVDDIAEYILTSCNIELKNGVNLLRLVKICARQAIRKNLLIRGRENKYKLARRPGRPARSSDGPDKKPKVKAKPIPICCFCLGDEKKNRSKEPEDMVSCFYCGQSGHPSCLKFSPSQTEVVQSLNDWECYDCKICCVCNTSEDNDNDMLICDRCDRSFHPQCCCPPVKKPPDGTWICHLCMTGNGGQWKTEPSSSKVNKKARKSSASGKPATKCVKFGLIRRKYSFKQACATPGCDGSGNVNTTMSNHRLQTSCPLLSKEARKKLKKQVKDDSGSEDGSKLKSVVTDSNATSAQHSVVKDLGLMDGLSQFFTPSEKRTSRVSMSSLLTATSTDKQPVKQPKSAATTSQAAANKLVKKSKLVQANRVQTIKKKTINNNTRAPAQASPLAPRSMQPPSTQAPASTQPLLTTTADTNSQPASSNSSSTFSLTEHLQGLSGASQLKGLVDGMTRFFTPTGERKRSVPIYVAPARKRKDTEKSATAARSGAEDSDLGGLLSDGSKSDGTVVDSIDKEHLPTGVSLRDYRLFRKSQKEAKELGSVALLTKPVIEHGKRYPPLIEFGKYELHTWYSSPYPQEYAQLSKLYICEFCLKYMKSKSILHRHMDKCDLTHPPANEIYRKDNLSVFEVDGNTNKIYCQNLCLLAKLFLDHKTLYYDVEPFLFYVLTCNDADGCHFVGYFSKEKHCQQKYNVSCITTLPQHQRKGYGKFLIDFSYLLSRIEGTPGSPEKPLSELGKISYKSYWKCTLLRYLHHHKDKSSLTIKGISSDTGMCAHDIASTLQDLHMIDTNTADDVIIALNTKVISAHMERLDAANTPRIVIDEDCVRWTPVISSHNLSSPEKSSSPDKASVVSLIRERRITIDAEVKVEPEPVKSPPPRRASSKGRTRQSLSRQGSGTTPVPIEKKSPERSTSPRRGMTSPNRNTSPVRSPGVNSRLIKNTYSRKPPTSNGPSLTNGMPPTAASRKRQSQISSSDEEDNGVVKPKPHPPKKRRASCKEEKISRRKSGSPSTPEKKYRYSSTRSNSTRRLSRSTRQQNSTNSTYSNSAVGDKHKANGKSHADLDSSYLSDGSSRHGDVAPCYDASASDTESDDSEMELSSNASAVWSPTIQASALSDTGSPAAAAGEGRLSRLDKYMESNDRITPHSIQPESTDLKHTPIIDTQVRDLPELKTTFVPINNTAGPKAHVEGSGLPVRNMDASPSSKSSLVTNKLPQPQSYPPNTAPEIDPTSLCFESPISLSSNDTSLNGSHPSEQISQHIDQQPTEKQLPVSVNTSSQPYNAYAEYPNNVQQSSSLPAGNQVHGPCGAVPNLQQQQQNVGSFTNSIPSITTEQQSHDYPMQQQQQHCYNTNTTANRITDQQHRSPQNIQQHSSPMFPPQSPQVMIPNSPHLAPQSPQVPQKSPLLHPHSPHIPPQSPHFNQTTGPILSPGHAQTPYNYRARTGSISKVTPPDLTPPPGTPSPSKPSPDRYQQYLQQSRVPQKSPNVTINSRDLQYGGGGTGVPSNMHQNMQNLSNNTAGYSSHQQQHSNTQHFFPANQYVDPRYFSPYHMQMAQTAQPAGGIYGQLPATNGMYGYHH